MKRKALSIGTALLLAGALTAGVAYESHSTKPLTTEVGTETPGAAATSPALGATATFGPPPPPPTPTSAVLPGSGGRLFALPKKSEITAFVKYYVKGCGRPSGLEHWRAWSVSLRFTKHCTVTAYFTLTKTARPTPTPSYTPPPTATAVPTSTATSVPQGPVDYLLQLINGARAQYEAAPLTLNGQLSACALHHAKSMAATGSIWHTNPSYPQDSFPNDICIPWSTAGQNVGQDNDPVMQGVLSDFDLMMSEPHSAGCSGNHACNIISPSYRQVGIGVYDDGARVWIVESFVAP